MLGGQYRNHIEMNVNCYIDYNKDLIYYMPFYVTRLNTNYLFSFAVNN